MYIKIRPATWLLVLFLLIGLTSCSIAPTQPEIAKPAVARPAPKIALVLGGGGTRGFAHIGVIKALEAQGIVPDIIVGTSAGAVVGSLYAYGYTGFDLQKLAIQMEEQSVIDWAWPDRGVFKGEALQKFINNAVKQTPMEKLRRPFAAVATDLSTGEMAVFRAGNTGQAVRASSAVPGIFQPVTIAGRNYVDGGLVRPVPVSVARALGADFVIAVDISNKPKNNTTASTLDILMQTFDIMSQTINRYELPNADIVIRPRTQDIDVSNLDGRHIAVLEGEKAAAAIMPELKAKLEKLRSEH
ncbi:MAG: patatin-like phospholipase family protein [Sulfuriferula sp.]|nr:patatin-like phospholipase family protein [Sulfuriferula sp.]